MGQAIALTTLSHHRNPQLAFASVSMPQEQRTDVSIYLSTVITAKVSDVWKILAPYDKVDQFLKLDTCTLESGSADANQVGWMS